MMKTIKNLVMCAVLMSLGAFCSSHSAKFVAAYNVMFPEYQVNTVQHVVCSGETLWSIANAYYDMEQKDCFAEFENKVLNTNRQLHANRRYLQPGDVVTIHYHTVVNQK